MNKFLSTPWLSSLTILLFIASMWIAVHAHIVSHHSEDDQQFLYYAASKLVNTEQHNAMVDTVSTFLKSEPDADFYSFRYDERQRVTGNYPLMSHTITLVRDALAADLTDQNGQYPYVLSSIYNIALHFNVTFIFLIFAIVLFAVRRDYLPAIAFGLMMILAIDWLLPWKVPSWILHVRPHNFTEVVERAFQAVSLIVTSGGMESFFPRGHFIVLTIPVFLLRWSDRYKTAYALAAFSCLVHISMGALLLVCLMSIDFLMRPKILKSPLILSIISIALAVMGSLGILTDTGTLTSIPIILAISAGVAGCLYVGARYIERLTPFIIRERVLLPLKGTGPIASDLIILYALWALLVPFAAAMYFIIGAPQNAWTWGELPGRYLMIVRGPLIVALAIGLFAYLDRKKPRWATGATFAGVALGVGLFVLALNKPGAFQTFPDQLAVGFAEREKTAIAASNGTPFEYVEADIYFSIARSIDLNLPLPMGLLNFTPEACHRRYHACEP
ncbi:hypothetical protein [Magnetovibrio sp.]|uniref:hypothetical protein n=1 Tax=Magnetovibrio sp. TaxID=2024836 RepID=UPI002F95459B